MHRNRAGNGGNVVHLYMEASLLNPLPSLFYDSGSWHLEAFQESLQRRPAITAFLTTPVEPLIEELPHQLVIMLQALAIAYHPIIVPVPAQFRR